MEEAVWIQEARDGDTAAFARLVEAYQTHVYNLTYRMLGERMAAEDAAQEAFLRAFKNLHRYDPSRSFRTWLLSIAAHHAIDRLRRRRPQVPLQRMVPQAGDDPGPERQVVQREAREAVQRLLTLLSPTDRAAVTLLYWYDCSYEEIAETLDLTVSAVKSRLYRARRTMAQAMEEGFDVL
ncbi:MAG: sigma-70 family RNA polymerase sigma factor [Anaerolineae bacterium]|jgi:RNA polymerase sigma-70 factor (ECF subfamily)